MEQGTASRRWILVRFRVFDDPRGLGHLGCCELTAAWFLVTTGDWLPNAGLQWSVYGESATKMTPNCRTCAIFWAWALHLLCLRVTTRPVSGAVTLLAVLRLP